MSMVKTPKEIEAMREGGRILALVLREASQKAVPGVSTVFLNKEVERMIRAQGATPSFLGYRTEGAPVPYPATLCASVNDAVVHAIPSENIKLKEGDIIGLDLGLWWKGLCVDAAVTVGVGNISAKSQKLIDTAREALIKGVSVVRSGARTGDVGETVQKYVESNGFGVVRDLAGHGVGNKVHEDPLIRNFGRKGTGEMLQAGMTIAIEPMVNEGAWQVKMDEDGWTIRTADGKLSAHFEHTILVTETGYEILTQV